MQSIPQVPSSTQSIYTPQPAPAAYQSAPSGAFGSGPFGGAASSSGVHASGISGGHVPQTINPAMMPPAGSAAPVTYSQHHSQAPLGSAPNMNYAGPFGSGQPTPPGSAAPAGGGGGGSLQPQPAPPPQQPPLAGGPPPLSHVGQYMPNVSRPQMTQAANPPVVANNIAYGPSYKMQYQRRSTSDKTAVKYTGFLPLEGVYEEDTCRIG